jgi:hypothetical protein
MREKCPIAITIIIENRGIQSASTALREGEEKWL